MKLSHKLTLYFVFVATFAITLAAVFVYFSTSQNFEKLAADQRAEKFNTVASDYYQQHHSWQGVQAELQKQGVLPPPTTSGKTKPDPQPYALIDANHIVVVSGGTYLAGDRLQPSALANGIEIRVDGKLVGTVIQTGQSNIPSSVEQKYLGYVQTSLLTAATMGIFLALILGLALSNSLSKPIKQLTNAALAMMKGDLSQQVTTEGGGEIAELALAFNQLSSDLDRATKAQRQMTADIAHDLNNPLSVIGGYVEAMENGTLQATPQRLALIMQEVHHLQRLVADLRTLSLADSGVLRLQLEPCELPGLLSTVTQAYQQQASDAGIQLVTVIQPGLPKLNCDPQRMRQVMENLLVNALRYTPRLGSITISASMRAADLEIRVQDTGSGIAEQDLRLIFDRAYRADSARTGDGSGLGLAIARSIVELHNGQISAESQLGKGSTFIITIPKA